jgi:hypothetical protein
MTGEPTEPSPLFGHGPDFGYFYYGAIWYGDELWNGGRMEDYNGDGLYDEYDALVWDDQENGGRGFREWETLEHPTLGEVEIGGFHPKFFSQNGPPDVLEHWIAVQALFNLEMAMHLPLIADVSADVEVLDESDDSATYRVTVGWTNAGKLPTALRQAQLVKIVQEDHVRLQFDSTLMRREAPVLRIIDPSTRDKEIEAGWTQPGESKSVSFDVRTYGVPGVRGEVEVLSTRGGVVGVPVVLGRPREE